MGSAPIAGILLVLWSSSAACHATRTRPSSPHVHGTADLQITVEDSRATAKLRIAGMSAVGFERAPRSDEEKARLGRFRTTVARASWLLLPPAAGCQLTGAEVSAPGFEVKPEAQVNDAHEEIHATVSFRCSDSSRLSDLSVKLFDITHDLETVNVEWITTVGQGSSTVKRGHENVSLGP